MKSKQKQLYTLEFNEELKTFRISDEPSGGGYITITEYCSPFKHRVFSCFLNRSDEELTKEYVQKSFDQMSKFWCNLIESNLVIIDA
tara:strand:- start:1818 stop:2078 length:261 start_codon:yes stop_codon:yes gene_type:complete